jgi:hypothetical protein
MFELFWHHVYVRAKSRTLTPCSCSSGVENPDTMFTFERSREPWSTCLCSSEVENLFVRQAREPFATWHLVYVRAESRTLTPCLRSSEVENPALLFSMFTFERSREPFLLGKAESRTTCYLTPYLCSSGVENTALLVYVRAESRTLCYLFMFERSREPCPTCLRSSGVENLVYVRAESRTLLYFTPCLCSSLPDTMFTFERSRELFVRQAESRTLRYLFMFERSREPCATLLPVHVRAESRTLRYFTPCLCSSEVENPLSNSNITNYFLFE